MTFFYDLNKKLDIIREKPELKHGQLNEGAGAVLNKLRQTKEGIEDRIGDLDQSNPVNQPAYQRKAKSGDSAAAARGMPQKEGVDKAAFAKLAPPKNKITFADKIAGAKKEVDEMLGDVAAEAIKGALSGGQKKLDKNKNGSLDANDFAMLRGGAKTSKGGTVTKTKTGIKHSAGPGSYGGSEDEGHPLDKLKGPSTKKLTGRKETDEGWDDMMKDVERRRTARKVGDVTHGAKHDTEEIPGGRRVTRRTDPNTGYSVGADDDTPASGEKRGRGRPKGSKGAIGAKGPSGKSKLMTKEGPDEGSDLVKLAKVIQSCTTREQLETARKMAQNFLRKHSTANDGMGFAGLGKDYRRRDDVVSDIERKNAELKGEKELDEKAVSKKQQRFMGMVHAAQKGEKPASKEVGKVAKTMKKKDAEDFASTKHKGLPEKKKPEAKKSDAPKKDSKPEGKKKEKTEEAGGTGTPTASSGFGFGKGIYDSMNRELETMISEGMNVNMSMNSDANGGPSKSLTVTATDDDALKLGQLLKMAGLGGEGPNVEGGADLDHPGAIEINGTMDAEGAEDLAAELRKAQHDHVEGNSDETCSACGSSECGCEQEVDEADVSVSDNQPDWPGNTEQAADNFGYSGGLNKPKASGMATIPVTDVSVDGEDKFSTPARLGEDDALARIREMAGIKEAKKPDANKDGIPDYAQDGKGSKDLGKVKDKEKKVDEGILASTANLWKEYKGHYGV